MALFMLLIIVKQQHHETCKMDKISLFLKSTFRQDLYTESLPVCVPFNVLLHNHFKPASVARSDVPPPGVQTSRHPNLERVRFSGPAKFFRGDKSVSPYRWFSRAVVSCWQTDVLQVLANRLGLSLPGNSAVRLTDRLDMAKVVDWDVKPKTIRHFKVLKVIWNGASDILKNDC